MDMNSYRNDLDKQKEENPYISEQYISEYDPNEQDHMTAVQDDIDKTYILDLKREDVNGDRIKDEVVLIGKKPFGEASPFVDRISLIIRDGKIGVKTRIPLKDNAGYHPTLFLGDFTRDKVKDILVSMDTGGSGGFTINYAYAFLNNQPKELFNYTKFNDTYKYDVIYRNDYKVKVISKNLKKRYLLDISYKDRRYLSEIYHRNGKLKRPVWGEVIPLGGLYPIDINRDGTYELLAFQRIIGLFNADTLGFVQTTLRWKGRGFLPVYQNVAIPGTQRGSRRK